MPYYNRDPKRDHNFDNYPYEVLGLQCSEVVRFASSRASDLWGLGFSSGAQAYQPTRIFRCHAPSLISHPDLCSRVPGLVATSLRTSGWSDLGVGPLRPTRASCEKRRNDLGCIVIQPRLLSEGGEPLGFQDMHKPQPVHPPLFLPS